MIYNCQVILVFYIRAAQLCLWFLGCSWGVYGFLLAGVCSSGEVSWQPEGAFGSEQLEHESGGEQRYAPVRQMK